ncbi:MAG: GIY-YIG nuclease family protein [Patescibacteria group bacterium]|nr:GIY-YIG nuclease family protein [Patescibacteria group bacterium]
MEKFKYIVKDKISQLPKDPGVYAFNKGNKLLYIGKAANIKERVKSHFQQLAYRDNLFIDQVSKIGYIKTDSEIEALILEANLIKKYQPKYNVIWRDDKNYFYVVATQEDFPRVFWTHQTKLFKIQNSKFKIQNIGPFVDGKAIKQTLKILRKVFPYRSCRVIPNRPCLWYHLNRCLAPCLLKISAYRGRPPVAYRGRPPVNLGEKMKRECQKNVKNLMKILKGGKNKVLKELRKEMKKTSENQDFETAGKIRDQISALERVMEHAKIFESQSASAYPEKLNWPATEKKLKEILKIKNKISKIEAYDVSNIQGQEATGSMVTFVNGQPDKNFYRRFKIRVQGKPNDLAMIKECLNRRFAHREWKWPDLILIDGGKLQLNAAIKTLKSMSYHLKPKIVALAKKKNELFMERQKKPILLKEFPREIFNLILQLRDEAHRFARKYHLKLREIDFLPKS